MPVKQVRFKLTHRNIRARFQMQKRFDPSFSLAKMGELFQVTKMCAYKWCRVITDEKEGEINDGTRCPLPSGPRRDLVANWINDGVLAQALERMKKK